MCVANPLLLVDLDVANPVCYPQPAVGPLAPLQSAIAAPLGDSASLRLPDFGLCAYDAGLVTSLSQGLDQPAGADRLVLSPAAWYAPAVSLAGLPTLVTPGVKYRASTDGGGVLQTTQVGLEGNFAYPGEHWQVLPRRYARGFTVEMAIYVGAEVLPALHADPTRGMLFYWGTRAANKFWEISHYSDGYQLNTGVPLMEAHPADPLEGLALHALGLRALGDGSIVVRWIDEQVQLRQATTSVGVLSRGWQQLVLSWCPDQPLPADPQVSECFPFRRGTLRLMVNGRQVLSQDKFPELRLRPLSGPTMQQYSVPFFLSWGSGTNGLRNAYLPADSLGTPQHLGAVPTVLETAFSGPSGVALRRLRLYEGGVTPLGARSLAADYPASLVWGSTDPLLG